MSLAPPTITLNTQQQYFVDKEKRFYVYELVNSLDGKVFYVGKGSNNRLNHHVRNARRRISEGNLRKMRKILSIEKLGGKVLAEKLIENLSEKDAFDMEELVIRRYRLENLTNLSYGGEGNAWTEESKEKLSKTKTGILRPPEVRKNMSLNRKGKCLGDQNPSKRLETRIKISNALRGKLRSKEHCLHISEGNRGKIRSLESRIKQSQSMKGIKKSEETKRKMGLSKRGHKYNLGRKHTPEAIEKMKYAARKRNPVSEETKQKLHTINLGKHLSGETKQKVSESLKLAWRKRKGELDVS